MSNNAASAALVVRTTQRRWRHAQRATLGTGPGVMSNNAAGAALASRNRLWRRDQLSGSHGVGADSPRLQI
jgi:hypothetical protein